MKQRTYRYVRGSDVVRDGMYLELIDDEIQPQEPLASIFYSDVTQNFTLDYFDPSVPREVLEEFVDRAIKLLPKTEDVASVNRPELKFDH